MTIDETYPYLVNDVMKYIEKTKEKHNDAALIDIILDYCIKNGIEVEAVGDAISSDVYLKSFIEKDCELHNVFGRKKLIEEW